MNLAVLEEKCQPAWGLLKDTAMEWVDDKGSRLGAALAYYSVFSLGPLLIIAIAVAGLIFGQEAAQGQLFGQLREFLGDNGAAALQAMLAGAQKHSAGIRATVISLVTMIVAATGVVIQLKDALNTIWGVKSAPGKGLYSFAKDYLISFAALLGLGFILIVSLVLTTALAVIGKYVETILPLPEVVLHLLNFIITFAVLTLMFAMMFKILPDVKIAWRDVWIGAIGTAFMFNLGKTLIGLYLGKQSLDSTYGAAASFVAILVWVYYLAQVLYFGAEFTKIYARWRGKPAVPAADAVAIGTVAPSAAKAGGAGSAGAVGGNV